MDLPSQEGCKGSRRAHCYEVMNLCYWSETNCPQNQKKYEIHRFERLERIGQKFILTPERYAGTYPGISVLQLGQAVGPGHFLQSAM